MRAPVKRKKIKKSLLGKGFGAAEGSKHTKYFFYYKGKKTSVFTFLSRGSSHKNYGKELLDKMSKQLKLTNSQFEELIECPLTEKDYIELLKRKRVLR